jgi:hypothetical protein
MSVTSRQMSAVEAYQLQPNVLMKWEVTAAHVPTISAIDYHQMDAHVKILMSVWKIFTLVQTTAPTLKGLMLVRVLKDSVLVQIYGLVKTLMNVL